jgi:hypothetical protein
VQDLGAEHAMLAVFGLEVAVVPETMRLHVNRQSFPKMISIPSKTGIEDRYLNPLAAVAKGSPPIHSEKGKVFGLILSNRRE